MWELAALAVPLAPFVVWAAGRRWRQMTMFVMVFLVFEGAFRKWVFPGLQGPIYFLKDLMLISAFVGFIIERKRFAPHERLMGSLRLVVLGGFVFCCLLAANPNSPSIFLWLIGMKSYFLYTSLLFMTPYLFESMDDLRNKLRLYMLIMIPATLIGLVQFTLPADHFLNSQVAHDVDAVSNIAVFGEDHRARTAGTFSYIGGYATFLPVMFAITLPFLFNWGRFRQKEWVALALMLSAVVALPTTGSRTVIVMMFLVGIGTLTLGVRDGIVTMALAVRLVLIGMVASVVVAYVSSSAVEAYVHRASNADDPLDRLFTPFTHAYGAFEQAPLLGYGVGTTHNSASTIMGTGQYWWLHGFATEAETGRIIGEIGVFGAILIYLAMIMVVISALTMVMRVRDPFARVLCATIACYCTTQTFGIVVNNPTGGLYFWFGAGLVFAVYRLEQMDRLRESILAQEPRFAPAPVWRGAA